MSNVTVQEALDSIVESARLIGIKETEKQRGNYTKDDSMFVEAMYKSISKNSNVVKAAFAEIEKCEPVKYEWFDEDSDEWVETTKEYYSFYERDEREVRFLYTSPQPRDWVGLTCEQKVNLREENDWYNFPNDLIEATEAKCKQLNTKG